MLDLAAIRDAWPRVRPWFSAVVLYAVGAVVGTWPLVLRISTHLPTGTLGSATVPFFNLWTLEWNVHSLARGYSGYWEAPIFYPTPGTFALSEAQAMTGLIFGALSAAVSGVTAYNLVLLGALVANALAARRLFVVLGASEVVATATGLLALGMPFVWKELGVLQLTMLWPVWLASSELAILAGAAGVLCGASRRSNCEPAGSKAEAEAAKLADERSATADLPARASADASGVGELVRPDHARTSTGEGGESREARNAHEGSSLVGEPSAHAAPPARRSASATNHAALVRLALWCAALVWTCTYYALFSAVFFVLAGAMFVRREFFRPPMRGALLLAGLLLLCSAYPLLAQQRVVGSYARSAKTIHDGGATLRAYTRLPRGTLAGRVLPPLAANTDRRSLYPGTIVLLLAAVGIWSRRKRFPLRRPADPAPITPHEADAPASGRPGPARSLASHAPQLAPAFARPARHTRFFLWCGICLAVALVLSFGARWYIGSFRPYEAIVEHYVPGFGNARSPYRFAAFVHVFLVVFAGLGLETLLAAAWRGARAGRWRPVLLMAAAAVSCLEPMVVEAPLARFPVEVLHASWVDWLAEHPGGAVAMLPPALSGKARDFEPTTVAMLQALRHGHPLLNGYSGFFPAITDGSLELLKQFPSARSKRLLAKIPVRYAVVDKAWLGPRTDAQLAPLTRVFDSATHSIYLVPAASR